MVLEISNIQIRVRFGVLISIRTHRKVLIDSPNQISNDLLTLNTFRKNR